MKTRTECASSEIGPCVVILVLICLGGSDVSAFHVSASKQDTGLCLGRAKVCSYCEKLANDKYEFGTVPSLEEFSAQVAKGAHEYLSGIVKDVLDEQDKVMESRMARLVSHLDDAAASIKTALGRTPESIGTITEHVKKSVQCLKTRSQKRLKDALDDVKNSDLDGLDTKIENLMEVIGKIEQISFIRLGDVFGKVACLNIFGAVHQCCVKNLISAIKAQSMNSGFFTARTHRCEEFVASGELANLVSFMEEQERNMCKA